MKNFIIVLITVLAIVSCKKETKNVVEISDAKEVKELNKSDAVLVDSENSLVTWKGFKPGGEHFGIIGISEGTLNIKEGNLIGGSFKFDMNSITDLDMPADDEYNIKLITHLKSPDFFNVEKFPTAIFEITEAIELEGDLSITGNLTIKETTKSITIPVAMVMDEGSVMLKSEIFTIDRTDFDVRYGSKKFFDNLKDKFINDEFELSFEIKSMKK